MAGNYINKIKKAKKKYLILDTTDAYTCSFTEFHPFCSALYYFSNFKEFNATSLA